MQWRLLSTVIIDIVVDVMNSILVGRSNSPVIPFFLDVIVGNDANDSLVQCC